MSSLFHFAEQYVERIWGGDTLRRTLNKDVPNDAVIGEAWLISDHPSAVSVVDEGPSQGQTLRQLIENDPQGILGARAQLTVHGRFPLLLKLLDSGQNLSVQVHPDDACAQRLGEPDVGKTEMWHVLDAVKGSELICGLDTSVTQESFTDAAATGEVEALMTRFEAERGMSVFVPAGTVHAICGGILIAEIQQNSDLTYRIHDYGRVDANGQSRELHIEKACQSIHFGSEHGGTAKPLRYSDGTSEHTVLAACRYFAAELVRPGQRFTRTTHGDSFHIALCASETVTVEAGGEQRHLKRGEAVLIAGRIESFSVSGTGTFLDYYVPDLQRDVIHPLLKAGHPKKSIIRLGGDEVHSDLANL